MSDFQLNDDDVVSMHPQHSWGSGDLFKFASLKQRLKDHLGSSAPRWLGDGIECEVLTTTGGGWRKATMRLRLEIVLDEPEPEVSDLVLSPSCEFEPVHE